MKHIPFHSIEQFRSVIKEVQVLYKDKPLPKLKFLGSVKLHGTNASIIFPEIIPQSRNNIISETQDNLGFASWVKRTEEIFKQLSQELERYKSKPENKLVLYGEWAGKGIQKGVAISEAEKAFYIFGLKEVNLEEEYSSWLYPLPSFVNYNKNNIYSVWDFTTFVEIIDFQNPETSQNILVNLTKQVEEECPIAKAAHGISGVGEGIVWTHLHESGKLLTFKVKGEKHSSSRVKVLANIEAEKVASITEFIDFAVTENRLQQMYDLLEEPKDMTKLGLFLKAVSRDVAKEESDTLETSGLTMKDIGGQLNLKAKTWYTSKL